jgi:hypothetical protein
MKIVDEYIVLNEKNIFVKMLELSTGVFLEVNVIDNSYDEVSVDCFYECQHRMLKSFGY